jgi:pimeloyl-ACP methyl ester carboxylesterase
VKKSIILLHGAVGSAKQLEPLLPLLENEFEVHALNLPGHGGSNVPSEPFSIPLFAEFVLSYLDLRGIDEAFLFGYSMGGYVSLYLASQQTERVKKVFTFGTKLDWNPEFAKDQIRQLNPEKIIEKVPVFAEALKQTHSEKSWKLVLTKTAEML